MSGDLALGREGDVQWDGMNIWRSSLSSNDAT